MAAQKKGQTKKPRGNAVNNSGSTAGKRSEQGATAARTAPSKAPPRTERKPPKRKNVSQTIPNGTLVHTTDDKLYGADGNSVKSRMGTVVDSNRKNEVAIVKYTTSETNGNKFENDKGFVAYGNRIYTKTVDGAPIILSNDGAVQKHVNDKRNITPKQANQIKKANIQESKFSGSNRAALQELKGRKAKKKKKRKK